MRIVVSSEEYVKLSGNRVNLVFYSTIYRII